MKGSSGLNYMDKIVKKGLKYILAPLLALVVVCACACSEDLSDVSPACLGYAAGETSEIYSRHAKDAFYIPVEIVRAFFIYTAKDGVDKQEDLFWRLIYDYDSLYARSVLEKFFQSPEDALEKMNRKAEALGLTGTVFHSITGSSDSEDALYTALKLEKLPFIGSRTCLRDCFLICRAFAEDPTMREILGTRSVKFPEISERKYRVAPLLDDASDFRVEETVLSIGGWTTNDSGKDQYVSLAAVEIEGRRSCAAVSAHTGDTGALSYASCDCGNLCGKVLGREYNLSYLPGGNTGGTGLVVGRSFFAAVLIILLCATAVVLILLIAVGVTVRFKRNREGRKKYTPPKD